MSVADVMAHARKYSKAYQYDLAQKKKTSCWSTEPIAMGNKTVLLRLLTKYGIMSIEMQEAFVTDYEEFEETQDAAAKRIDADAGSEVIDTTFENNQTPEEQLVLLDCLKCGEPAKESGARPGIFICSDCGYDFDPKNP